MIEGVLQELGVQITGKSGNEIQGYCPVHHLVEGQPQSKPKWYINDESGAWICFTCGQRGSLPSLVQALGGDPSTIEHLKLTAAVTVATRWTVDEDGEEIEERVFIDPVIFDAHPRPPVRVMDGKDVDPEACARYNARWDAKGKCWMLPIYSFDNELLGWQEKSKGYFMNVPKGVEKSRSLFGWHLYREGTLTVVESPLDAIRFASYGIQAVATYGSFISEEQLDHLFNAHRLVLAFDNDDAGDHATEQTINALIDRHSRLRVFQYPRRSRGADPGVLTPTQLVNGFERAKIPPPKHRENKKDEPKRRHVVRRKPVKRF